jgi:hypothetical protein
LGPAGNRCLDSLLFQKNKFTPKELHTARLAAIQTRNQFALIRLIEPYKEIGSLDKQHELLQNAAQLPNQKAVEYLLSKGIRPTKPFKASNLSIFRLLLQHSDQDADENVSMSSPQKTKLARLLSKIHNARYQIFTLVDDLVEKYAHPRDKKVVEIKVSADIELFLHDLGLHSQYHTRIRNLQGPLMKQIVTLIGIKSELFFAEYREKYKIAHKAAINIITDWLKEDLNLANVEQQGVARQERVVLPNLHEEKTPEQKKAVPAEKRLEWVPGIGGEEKIPEQREGVPGGENPEDAPGVREEEILALSESPLPPQSVANAILGNNGTEVARAPR